MKSGVVKFCTLINFTHLRRCRSTSGRPEETVRAVIVLKGPHRGMNCNYDTRMMHVHRLTSSNVGYIVRLL
jgi:hypothetical protein